MRCTGYGCERKNQCARYYIIAPDDGQCHTLENLYSFGSGSIGPDGHVEEHLVCSERGNWGMFVPIPECEWCYHFRCDPQHLISEGNGMYKELIYRFCPMCGRELGDR